MVFKKPFAFLIKQFKKIHLILFILLAYVFYKSLTIAGFFKDYLAIDNVVNIPEGMVNLLLFAVTFIILIFGIIMYTLMKQKEKPSKLYLSLIVYYSVLIILFFVASSTLKEIAEAGIVSLENRRIYLDIANIFTYPQLIFLVYSLVRVIGFDIRSFDFGKDLKELSVSESDNEEFEFVLGVDYDKIKTKGRKQLREFRYYILENIKIFLIMFLVLASGILIYFAYNTLLGEKVYKEGENLQNSKYKVTILNSYLTNISQKGVVVTKDKYYLVVSLRIKALTSKSTQISTSDFKVTAGDYVLLPIFSKNTAFVDLGKPYNKEHIDGNTDYYYLFIYEVPDYTNIEEYYFKISGATLTNKAGEQYIQYLTTKLKPSIVGDVKVTESITYNPNSTTNILDFRNTALKNSYIKIRSFTINNKFLYSYKHCFTEANCQTLTKVIAPDGDTTTSVLLVIDADLVLDSNSLYSKYYKDKMTFFSNFMQIKYTNAGVSKIAPVKIKNTAEYEEQIILEVPSTINISPDLYLEFTIRNSKHIIKLK